MRPIEAQDIFRAGGRGDRVHPANGRRFRVRRIFGRTLSLSLLIGVGLTHAGCLVSSQKQSLGDAGGRPDDPATLQDDRSYRPASDPILRERNVLEAEQGIVAFRPTADDEARLGRCVDEAFNAIMTSEPTVAVEKLTEAQTIRGWAQSQYAASILYWLGQAHERLDEHTAAMSSYRKVLTLYPNSPWSKRARKRLTALESRSQSSDESPSDVDLW